MRSLPLMGLGSALCLMAAPASALLQTCTVSATATAFGSYSPASVTALSGTGTITLTCTGLVSLLDSWTIALSTGNSGSFAPRQLKTGANTLNYNLYTSAALSAVWGDGSAGTSTVSDSETLVIGTSVFNYTVYGRIPALQDKPPGTYTDVITVTVNY